MRIKLNLKRRSTGSYFLTWKRECTSRNFNPIIVLSTLVSSSRRVYDHGHGRCRIDSDCQVLYHDIIGCIDIKLNFIWRDTWPNTSRSCYDERSTIITTRIWLATLANTISTTVSYWCRVLACARLVAYIGCTTVAIVAVSRKERGCEFYFHVQSFNWHCKKNISQQGGCLPIAIFWAGHVGGRTAGLHTCASLWPIVQTGWVNNISHQ